MNKSLKNIPSHIVKFIGGLELKPISEVMKLSDEERFNHAAIGHQLELAGILYKGFSLLGLKENLGHGEYMSALAKRGMGKDEAWKATNLAVLSTRVSAPNFAALRNLSPTKLGMMAKWDDDELDAFFSGQEVRGITYDDAITYPTREMDRRIKASQTSNNELEQKIEKQNIALAKAEEEIRLYKKSKNSIEGFDYPPSVERVRIESSVLGSQAIQCLDDMEQFMVELTQASDLNRDKKKQEAEFSAGACTLYINLKSVYSKASYLLKWFEETVGDDYMPTDPIDTPLLTQEEAMQIFNMREVMLIEHGMEKQARESQRKSNRRKNKKAKK